MAAALTKLRDLLGPISVPVEVETADTSALEQLVEDAFAELSGFLPTYSGPNATDLAADRSSSGGNDIPFLAVALGAEIADPVERLQRIRHSTKDAKQMQKAIGARELSELSASFPGALSSWGFKTLAATEVTCGSRRPMANVGVSNVPGPQVPLYMNGVRAAGFLGVAPVFHGAGLNFGVFSYCGRIEVTFVSCRRTVPDPAFVAECLQAAYDELTGALQPTPRSDENPDIAHRCQCIECVSR